MNTCVSDHQTIVNIQGIRYVKWGESSTMYSGNAGKPFFVTVNYKNTHDSFFYRTEEEARAFFTKIRTAMDKTYGKTPDA